LPRREDTPDPLGRTATPAGRAHVIRRAGHAIRFRGVVRLGLIGYALTTIIASAIQGPYFTTDSVAKPNEVTQIILEAIDFRPDGRQPDHGRQE
jgi:hypothetical protein